MQTKPELPMVVVPVFRTHYEDLEAYIQQVFGFEYDYFQATGLSSGIVAEFNVTGKFPSVEWQRRADKVRAGRRDKSVILLLNVLVADGYIPAGKYLISSHKRPDPIEVYKRALLDSGDPESDVCKKIKAKFASNPTFVERASIVDAAWRNR